MLKTVSFVAFIASAVKLANAHGQITSMTIGGKTYPAGNFYYDADPVNGETPLRTMIPNDVGYVKYTDVNSNNIACGYNGNKPAPVTAPIKAGQSVSFKWVGDKGYDGKQWPHPNGYEVSYLASCEGPCANFNTDNAKWVKFEEFGLDTSQRPSQALLDITRSDNQLSRGKGLWAQSKLMEEDSVWTVTLPSSLKAGEYILRHELVSLHSAATTDEGAQYYPGCVQLAVSGGGDDFPSGTATTQLYTREDGLVMDFYDYGDEGLPSYKVPGPALAKFDGSASSPTPATDTTPAAKPSASSTPETPEEESTPSPEPDSVEEAADTADSVAAGSSSNTDSSSKPVSSSGSTTETTSGPSDTPPSEPESPETPPTPDSNSESTSSEATTSGSTTSGSANSGTGAADCRAIPRRIGSARSGTKRHGQVAAGQLPICGSVQHKAAQKLKKRHMGGGLFAGL